MIEFKTIRWKNFLSTGNSFTTFDFKHKATLIVGKNGSGKSTLLDALVFGLFNKSFRNVKRNDLVNSINKKDCVVEIDFVVGKVAYKVIRSIKPNRFEVYESGVLWDTGDVTSQQNRLEKNVIRCSRKSFCQIIILGSSQFIPFMKLGLDKRREIIESILDLQVFTKMNIVVKEKIKNTKEEKNNAEVHIDSKKGAIKAISVGSDNSGLVKIKEESIEKYKNEAREALKNKKIMISKVESLQEKIDSFVEIKEPVLITELEDGLDVNTKKLAKLEYMTQQINTDLAFYEQNDTCSQCNQSIEETFKNKKIEELETKKNKCKKAFVTLNSEINRIKEELTEVRDQYRKDVIAKDRVYGELSSAKSSIGVYDNQLLSLKKSIKMLKHDIATFDEQDKFIESEKKAIQNELDVLEVKYAELTKEYELCTVSLSLLKDNAVKSKIIDYYIPIINQSINKILFDIGLYINFEFDSNFKESIQSRCVDSFTYDSFSEGEKARIDIAILLTLNHISKLKNSINANILILDEIFDSSLDRDGSSNLSEVLKTFDKNLKVVVISHVENIEDRFNRVINVSKTNNFTEYAETLC